MLNRTESPLEARTPPVCNAPRIDSETDSARRMRILNENTRRMPVDTDEINTVRNILPICRNLLQDFQNNRSIADGSENILRSNQEQNSSNVATAQQDRQPSIENTPRRRTPIRGRTPTQVYQAAPELRIRMRSLPNKYTPKSRKSCQFE